MESAINLCEFLYSVFLFFLFFSSFFLSFPFFFLYVQKSVLVVTKHAHTPFIWCVGAGGRRGAALFRDRERERQERRAPANGLGKLTNGTKRNGSPLKYWFAGYGAATSCTYQSNPIKYNFRSAQRGVWRKAMAEKRYSLSRFREQSLAAAGHCCCHRCNAYYYLIRLRLFPSFQFLCRCRFPESGLVGKALLFTDFYRTTTKTTTHTTKCKCNT